MTLDDWEKQNMGGLRAFVVFFFWHSGATAEQRVCQNILRLLQFDQ
jgi:hypothetical protein